MYLWAISQEMPEGKHEHIQTYDFEQLKQIIWNEKWFRYTQVNLETWTSEHLKEKFCKMTHMFKNAENNLNKFEEIGDCVQNNHTKNDIKINKK